MTSGNKIRSSCVLGLTCTSLFITLGLNAHVERRDHGTGLKPITPEHIQHIEKHWPKVHGVKPNSIGAARINHHIDSQGLQAEKVQVTDGEEFVTTKHSNFSAFNSYGGVLPAYVDNSILPSFPPIGDQGQEGCCVAFGSTYYQATHEVGLMNGYNNKTSNTHILSPKWTYNMINGGGDNGSYPPDAFTLLSENGAVSIAALPYVAGDFLSWDLNTKDWVAAMSNRTSAPTYVTGIGGSSQNLTQIKQLLNNGHVLTFATFVDSWQFSQILSNPTTGADNRFVGQYAVNYLNGQVGGHYITIVGYNDNIWVDINGNGKVDPGEMGAFLIANSWGNWGNNGFIWVSYDAFLSTSAVAGGPSTGRIGAAAAFNNYVVNVTGKSPNYKPSLIAEFGLTSANRSQIGISAGVSATTATTPAQTFKDGSLYFQGGSYGFDGTMATETATFALDLSDLVNLNVSSTNRFYLMVADNLAGNPTTVQSYSLIDNVQGTTTNAASLPVTVDNNSVSLHIDHTVTPPPPAQKLTVAISAPVSNSTVSCSTPVSATAQDSIATIASMALYVDGALITTNKSAPYTFILDTTKLTNGSHTLSVIGTDTANNTSSASVVVQVHNGCP